MKHLQDQGTDAVTERKRRHRKDQKPALAPDIVDAIEDTIRRLYVNPYAEAFSIEDFCEMYGVGRQLAYDEINAGRLIAHKPGDPDYPRRRTLIRRADAERWLDKSPTIKPRSAEIADATA